MLQASINTLQLFEQVLRQLEPEQYTASHELLAHASIGQHSRHIIELYQCLLKGYESGRVCYDKRERDIRIETDLDFALETIEVISAGLDRPNRSMNLILEGEDGPCTIETNYDREVLYNLEHAIHHHALMKVALIPMDSVDVPVEFGVAPSTLAFRKSCAQ